MTNEPVHGSGAQPGAYGVLSALSRSLPALEALYKDLHAHPELALQETRTADIVAAQLTAAGYEVATGVGRTGVVGMLRNGAGPTVMLRADMDALPVREATGLPYASVATGTDRDGRVVPLMHACGHDMHVAWLIGAARLLADARAAWSGTLMLVFQPAEETGEGARAMIDDGLFDRFARPDVVLGQHVMTAPAGTLGSREGVITSAGDSLEIRMFGRGAHGSMPQASVDPVVMAAATVLRLQTVVSREIGAAEQAVVTVGALQAGTKANVIPDDAVIKVNVRTYDAAVRERVLTAIERIVNAESAASGAPRPPEIRSVGRFLPVENDGTAIARVGAAFRGHFGTERVVRAPPTTASEDFGLFGVAAEAPAVFWFVGGTDADEYERAKRSGRPGELVTNHNPRFAPVIHPTLATGVEAMVVAALAWLGGAPT
ncbi:MAG TPA: amidohydrolase [Longimicrobiales bacterium]